MHGFQTAFQHYSHCVSATRGRQQTFDAIAKGAATMNQAAFMRCCKDFGLLGTLLDRPSLERLYKETVAA
jgi:hypothetical protein